ncbi:MAG: sigma-54-dependent Fis family transcriptional regulator [Nitrospinae bacterium]|nr:sigma-54-dependent Fis family transcriptional regulator [Nitrospinota bacterium]MBF0633072.1 sigma-54-dependent Fis family transcriptional regulator [Nitrospinota bacterium]
MTETAFSGAYGKIDATALIVDDDDVSLSVFSEILGKGGMNCLKATSGNEALNILTNSEVDIILADYSMPEMDGVALYKEVRARRMNMPYVILTGYGSVDNAVACMKLGIYDYIQKPCDPNKVLTTIRNSINHFKLSEENKRLKSQIKQQFNFQDIVTVSPAMADALKLAAKVAMIPGATVAIYGESGVGKEVLARAIHNAGSGLDTSFVAVNCAGMPAGLMESELFGHVRGAFTSADKDRPGKMDMAKKGTLLLDEIGDMPLDLQVKLLRVLQEKTYEMLGSNKQIKAEFRLIVASHNDLTELARMGSFREDLCHRVNMFPIRIPPLRERKEDVSTLSHYFLDQFRKEFGKPLPGISEKAMEALMDYHWPGNVRELKNCIERAAILTDDGLIQPRHLIIFGKQGNREHVGAHMENNAFALHISLPSKDVSLDNIVSQALQLSLEMCGNNKSRAADLLKVDRGMFYRKK